MSAVGPSVSLVLNRREKQTAEMTELATVMGVGGSQGHPIPGWRLFGVVGVGD